MGSLFFEIEAKENALISARQSTLAVVREKENTAATWTDELDRLDGKWKSVEEEIPFRLASPRIMAFPPRPHVLTSYR